MKHKEYPLEMEVYTFDTGDKGLSLSRRFLVRKSRVGDYRSRTRDQGRGSVVNSPLSPPLAVNSLGGCDFSE